MNGPMPFEAKSRIASMSVYEETGLQEFLQTTGSASSLMGHSQDVSHEKLGSVTLLYETPTQ